MPYLSKILLRYFQDISWINLNCHIFLRSYQDLVKILPRYFMNKSCHIFLRSYQDLAKILPRSFMNKYCHIFLRSYQDLVKIFPRYFMNKSHKILPSYCQDFFYDLCKQEQILSYMYLSQDLHTITRWESKHAFWPIHAFYWSGYRTFFIWFPNQD